LILAFINVNNMGSHNVAHIECTFSIMNIDLRMVWINAKRVPEITYYWLYVDVLYCDWI